MGLLNFRRLKDSEKWLGDYPIYDGVTFVSDSRSYAHAESDYDSQYGHTDTAFIEKAIGKFVLDALPRTPSVVLELACGTGLLTGSLMYDGRIKHLVASDASVDFLKITKSKTNKLQSGTKLRLACIKDSDFGKIPRDTFDAIMMRSALHHFVEFREVARILIEKIKPGGFLCMLEPRADFHTYASLILKNCQVRAGKCQSASWSDKHDRAVTEYVAMTEFYLDRVRDKTEAEDKYAFHIEEFLEIAGSTRTSLRCIGAEYSLPFSVHFIDFLKYCMSYDPNVVADIGRLAADELSFMDRVYKGRPGYGAAEWFVFEK